jgi:hypothetical protein
MSVSNNGSGGDSPQNKKHTPKRVVPEPAAKKARPGTDLRRLDAGWGVGPKGEPLVSGLLVSLDGKDVQVMFTAPAEVAGNFGMKLMQVALQVDNYADIVKFLVHQGADMVAAVREAKAFEQFQGLLLAQRAAGEAAQRRQASGEGGTPDDTATQPAG